MKKISLIVAGILLLAVLLSSSRPIIGNFEKTEDGPAFDGQLALKLVQAQMELGARVPGSVAHQTAGDWIVRSLQNSGWTVEEQNQIESGRPVRNITGKRGEGSPWIIFGAHYDCRQYADRDPLPEKRSQPAPGANDGASGVAVLLELARVLPADFPGQIWLVFFDMEDQGGISGQNWIVGSTVYARELKAKLDAVVVLDMIGDADQQIYIETTSTQSLVSEIWATAAECGYGNRFISKPEHTILDDHTPFLKAGIPAVDIIDFDYPWWHTIGDTADKISAESLEAVGRTLEAWLGISGCSS